MSWVHAAGVPAEKAELEHQIAVSSSYLTMTIL
eukprot:CAMPEP_0119320106 /NCGR_PEP_ID=MMETSP1333-20130426/51459_1 /TAXON_ID=418940 /ORGANISM="Scyphosphaera apsteinii, Strain RCC1455" /LENGTH=32 /DNA_ID= /DNA_START= /DNA_END= /DNA_ORIENTATION=